MKYIFTQSQVREDEVYIFVVLIFLFSPNPSPLSQPPPSPHLNECNEGSRILLLEKYKNTIGYLDGSRIATRFHQSKKKEMRESPSQRNRK